MDNDQPLKREDSLKNLSEGLKVGDTPFYEQHIAIAKRAAKVQDPEKDIRDEALLHEMIEIHRKELEDVGTQLAKEARKRAKLSSIIKAVVIFLGAFVAIKEVVNQLVGSSNTMNIIIFTIAGLLIAILTGLEAAFKWENTAAELKSLVATSRAASRNAASNLAKAYATTQGRERLKELNKILDVLDNAIVDVQKRSATLGIETVMHSNTFKNRVQVFLEISNISRYIGSFFGK